MAERRAVATAVTAMLLCACLVGVTLLTVGSPSIDGAGQFFRTAGQDNRDGAAAAALLCWLVVIGVAAISTRLVLRPALLRARIWTILASLIAAAGLALLAHGIASHNANHYAMCCGGSAAGVDEAMRLVR